MKIAIFTESYRPVVNGVARSVDTLVDSLHARGHEAIVYAPKARRGTETRSYERRYPSYYLPMAPDYPLAFPLSPSLSREFGTLGFDLVHVQTPFAMGLCGQILARRHRLSLLAHMHTLYTEYAHYVPLPRTPARAIIRFIVRTFYNRADAVVAPSPSIRRLLQQDYGIIRPIHVAPTGVDITARCDRKEARVALGLPDRSPVLLYTGRLAPEKNIGLLIEAFALVQRQVPATRLLILGDGPARRDAERVAYVQGVSDSIIFGGMRPRSDVKLACSAADLYLFPSQTDTQALSVVEAMACGVPAVVVDAYGPADVVQDGVSGRVVPANAEAMAGATISLLNDDRERSRLGEGAFQRAGEYSISAMADRILSIYVGLVGTSPIPG